MLARAADVRASEDVDDDVALGRVGSRHEVRVRGGRMRVKGILLGRGPEREHLFVGQRDAGHGQAFLSEVRARAGRSFCGSECKRSTSRAALHAAS